MKTAPLMNFKAVKRQLRDLQPAVHTDQGLQTAITRGIKFIWKSHYSDYRGWYLDSHESMNSR